MMPEAAVRWRIRRERPIEYDLIKAPDLLHPNNPALLACGRIRDGRRFVVVDTAVHHHHGARIERYFAHHGIHARILPFAGGEAGKTVESWLQVMHALDDFPIHRRDEPIIAIGGGVLTDVVGFAAGSYRRGIPHVKVPTTLMGYVDASVGIKTGCNFNGHKNRIGSFEPPMQVLLDPTLLQTLPPRHLRNGLCEIIKLAVIADAELFRQLEQAGAAAVATAFQGRSGQAILDRAIDGMLTELAPNLFESDLARKVDFGHTFSYGLETRHAERLLHGEAVLLDVLVSTRIAQRRGLLPAADARRIFRLVDHLGMRPDVELLDARLMWQALLDRVEHRNGRQRVPLPRGIGACGFVDDITPAELTAAAADLNPTAGAPNVRLVKC